MKSSLKSKKKIILFHHNSSKQQRAQIGFRILEYIDLIIQLAVRARVSLFNREIQLNVALLMNECPIMRNDKSSFSPPPPSRKIKKL